MAKFACDEVTIEMSMGAKFPMQNHMILHAGRVMFEDKDGGDAK